MSPNLASSRRAPKAKADASIMGTNNSSIVSKRSVERLYYPEPHFFRYFVKKPRRRSPLINRGYWLRMHAVDTVVRRFLEEHTNKPKIVINLGCGYDPLPFQWLSKAPGLCQNVLFVDVDYPELMAKKCATISQTPQLSNLVGSTQVSNLSEAVLYHSAYYIAIGCDLTDLKAFDDFLAEELKANSSMVLCTAEVSVTYMNTGAADALIACAAKYHDICFCLLEQYLPDGASHPFAKQMIQHFDNLHTPLRSVHQYPQLSDQEHRFERAGWHTVRARSLWQLWGDPTFLISEQRLALNNVEPFDEWEDFALFASHYFLLEASNGVLCSESYQNVAFADGRPMEINHLDSLTLHHENSKAFRLYAEPTDGSSAHRRFGATLCISQGVVGHHGGLGSERRVNTTNIYRIDGNSYDQGNLPPGVVGARMCHTITHMADGSCLLVGGRTSPDNALSDCWLSQEHAWKRVDDLPVPLYRQCATSVRCSHEGVLIFGGRTNSRDALNSWLLWSDCKGWTVVSAGRATIQPRFGASMASTSPNGGILFGGMAADGTVLQDFWLWELHDINATPSITLVRSMGFESPSNASLRLLCRLGACVELSAIGFLLIGGIMDSVLSDQFACICIPEALLVGDGSLMTSSEPFAIKVHDKMHRPLLVGHSVYQYCGSIIILGGGANCFSFGTYWNQYNYTLRLETDHTKHWKLDHECKSKTKSEDNHTAKDGGLGGGFTTLDLPVEAFGKETVATTRLENARDFERIVNNSKPVKMESMDLGPCLRIWSFNTLKTKVGVDRPVVVHEAIGQHMNFQAKNFIYTTKPLSLFLEQIDNGSQQYLRSLSAEKPSEKPAQFAADFPELAADFVLPPQLEMVAENAHSSPLRISGPVNMWLHYDVMANILCQIKGSKRVILYPPSDIAHLKVPPGESSSRINIIEASHLTEPSLAATHPRETILRPGDVLFIPPLWLHASSPLERTSISINVFFRNLKTGYAAGRDVYGNRDVQAYEKGRKDVARMVQSFDQLPAQMSRFYLERLAEEIRSKAVSIAP